MTSEDDPLQVAGVEDMANLIIATRLTCRVGKRWTERFIKRYPELKTRFLRV